MVPLLFSAALAATASGEFREHYTLVWAGIDFRGLEMYVPERFSDPTEKIIWGPGGGLFDFVGTFPTQKDAWLRLCTDWNQMYTLDRVPEARKIIGGDVLVENPDNCAASYGQEPRFYVEAEANRHPPHVNDTDIASAVRTWPMERKEGVAMLVVAERYSKNDREACVWPTFFDLTSRQVLWTDRVCESPSGLGFRNFWFNPLATAAKDALTQLAKGGI